MAATIHDVAELAGVSPRTVSNVVNHYAHVRPETRQRVLDAIAAVNYRPNISARRLRLGRTGILGLAVPELSQPYFAELSELVELAARRRGYTVITAQTGGGADDERVILREFTSHLVDGLVFSALSMTASDIEREPPSVPTVFIGEQIVASDLTSIAIDNVQAARDITSHLISTGRRRIAALGGFRSDDYRSSRLRLQGYREALDRAGIPFDESLILHTDRFGRRVGRDRVARALSEGVEFDAIAAFTDILGLGAIRALADVGLGCPGDVAVAAIDNVQEAAFTVPSLTTIAPDKHEIAEQAVSIVIRLVDGDDYPAQDVLVPQRLVVRESSGAH